MCVPGEQPEGGATRGSPVHSETLCASVGGDGECGGVCTIFFVVKAG